MVVNARHETRQARTHGQAGRRAAALDGSGSGPISPHAGASAVGATRAAVSLSSRLWHANMAMALDQGHPT